jgi:hypothetical protein
METTSYDFDATYPMELRATAHDNFKYSVTHVYGSKNFLFKITNLDEIDPSKLNSAAKDGINNGTDYTLYYYCTHHIGTGVCKYNEKECTEKECWIDPGFSDEKMWIKWETKEMKMEVIRLMKEAEEIIHIGQAVKYETEKHIAKTKLKISELEKNIKELDEDFIVSIITGTITCYKKYKQQQEKLTKESEDKSTKESEEKSTKESEEKLTKESEEKLTKESEEKLTKESKEKLTKESTKESAEKSEEDQHSE